MKQKIQKIIKITAFAAFAIAMLVNLKSNIIGESGFNKAFATETGPVDTGDTGPETEGTTLNPNKYRWTWPSCEGERMCGSNSETYTGIKLKCADGSDYLNCTDGTKCIANKACGM